jgi:adenylate cyclase
LPQNIEIERRLAAVLAADVARFSRLTEADEVGTMRMLATQRAILDTAIARHRGRIANTAGDSVLAEFPSAVNAVQCAVEAQQALRDAAEGEPADRRVLFRIGIHVGDVMVRGGDLLGNGVNVAARLEALADAGGIVLSAAAHEQVKKILPLVYTDLGAQSVKNIEEPVRAFVIGTATVPSTASALLETGKPLPLPDKPSIAVLPFQNMGGDHEQEYFADGMVEEIITALSRIRWLFVIARNSSFTYKGQAVDVKRVGRELGVRYVLEGSVRKGGNRVRITAQLIEAETGAHLWADRFDGSLEDVFDLQDKVASSVVGVIEPTLQAAETSRSSRRPINDLTAYDLYLRAYSMFLSPARNVSDVLRLLDQVIERDPNYGPALAWAAICHFLCDFNGWGGDFEVNRRMGVDRGRRALLVAGDDPTVLANGALALGYFGEDIGAMIELAERALALNPSFARGWHVSGLLRFWAGKPDIAIEHVENSLRLSPRARVGWGLAVIGWAHFAARRFDQAVPKFHLAIQEDPIPATYLGLAASYAQMGRLDQARGILAQRPAGSPTSVTPIFAESWRDPEHRQLLVSGLRLAAGGG